MKRRTRLAVVAIGLMAVRVPAAGQDQVPSKDAVAGKHVEGRVLALCRAQLSHARLVG